MSNTQRSELEYLHRVLLGHHSSNPTSLGVDIGMAMLRRQIGCPVEGDDELLEMHNAHPPSLPDLKEVLMHLGNKLVTEHGHDPNSDCLQSTRPITEFTKWLNSNSDARVVLRELGYDWSMPKWRPGDPV